MTGQVDSQQQPAPPDRGRYGEDSLLRKRFRRLLCFWREADGDKDGTDQGHHQVDFHGRLVSGLQPASYSMQKAFHFNDSGVIKKWFRVMVRSTKGGRAPTRLLAPLILDDEAAGPTRGGHAGYSGGRGRFASGNALRR